MKVFLKRSSLLLNSMPQSFHFYNKNFFQPNGKGQYCYLKHFILLRQSSEKFSTKGFSEWRCNIFINRLSFFEEKFLICKEKFRFYTHYRPHSSATRSLVPLWSLSSNQKRQSWWKIKFKNQIIFFTLHMKFVTIPITKSMESFFLNKNI